MNFNRFFFFLQSTGERFTELPLFNKGKLCVKCIQVGVDYTSELKQFVSL